MHLLRWVVVSPIYGAWRVVKRKAGERKVNDAVGSKSAITLIRAFLVLSGGFSALGLGGPGLTGRGWCVPNAWPRSYF